MSKTRGGTHAHYAGEFGSTPRHQLGAREQTSTLAKNPEYRAARAEHFAHVAHRASEAHRVAQTSSERAQHALVVEHAHQMSQKHARAAEKMAPGSEHAGAAARAVQQTTKHRENIDARESTPGAGQTQKIEHRKVFDKPMLDKAMLDEIATKSRTRDPSLPPEEKVRTAALHEQMAKMTVEHASQQPAFRGRDKKSDPSKRVTQPISVQRNTIAKSSLDIHHFTRVVQEAVNAAPVEHGFGDRKVFIHRAHQAVETHFPGMTLHEFKETLRAHNSTGQLNLARADMVGAMNQHDVIKSTTTLSASSHGSDPRHSGSVVNFIHRTDGFISREALEEHSRMKESMGHQKWRETEFK